MSTEAEVLELDPIQPGEEPMKQIGVWESFKDKAEKLRATAETLVVTDVNDRVGMAMALWKQSRQVMKDGAHTKEIEDGVEKFAAWVERKAQAI